MWENVKHKIAIYLKFTYLCSDEEFEQRVKQTKEKYIRSYARFSDEIVGLYIDRGESNDAFEKMIEDSKKNKFGWICTYNLFMFGGNRRKLKDIICELQEKHPPTYINFRSERISTSFPWFWETYNKYYEVKNNLLK